ncbi:uncharacterized protein LOC122647302 [Telopea speciosissima]|uniref:uncharacterized protein LOC122647302 n=1 Tax=Telopea speciosissima TaxID=54955 RepID=UPI001CC424BF|nr:uncharacterized protein LOC122647302 [Telopea speciosissima]
MDAMNAFNDCIEDIAVNDLRWSGFPLTWSNKRAGNSRIACKLDRVLVNEEWLHSFPSSHASFENPGISDHSPISLDIQPFTSFGPKPFKYFDMWSSHPTFLPVVLEAWQKPVYAFSSPLIAFSKRLKNVKAALKDWNLNIFGNITLQVPECKDRLHSIQARLQSDLHNVSLAAEEKVVSNQLSSLLASEESFLKQKSRMLSRKDGSIVNTVKDIKDLAVQHFKGIFTGLQEDHATVPSHLLNKFIAPEFLDSLSAIPKEEEIVKAIHSLKVIGAPGPDGFSMGFFIAAWDIIKSDLIAAIESFFLNPNQVNGINHTFLCLIPKKEGAIAMNDFRHIALCNLLYKFIAKILARRLKSVVDLLVSDNQTAFIPGRNISDNILLCNDIVRGFERKNHSPSLLLKIDIHKAFDSIWWDFIAQQFKDLSGLRINSSKSLIFFAGVSDSDKAAFLASSRFLEGQLPVKLVLIRSVLEASYIYWSGIYVLPQVTIKALEALMASFLWKGSDTSRFLHPLSWAAVCLPKKEGGLGIRRIKDVNSAGIIKLLWEIALKKKSIWVDWIYLGLLRHDSIWTAASLSDASRVWRKILACRPLVLQAIRSNIGDGQSTYLWLDNWHPRGILLHQITPRSIYSSDFHRLSLVADILDHNGWAPPPAGPSLTAIWNELHSVTRRPISSGDCVTWSRATLAPSLPRLLGILSG